MFRMFINYSSHKAVAVLRQKEVNLLIKFPTGVIAVTHC